MVRHIRFLRFALALVALMALMAVAPLVGAAPRAAATRRCMQSTATPSPRTGLPATWPPTSSVMCASC